MTLFGWKKKDSKARLKEAMRGQEPPAFPQGVMQLLRLMRDPESDLQQIAEALNWNPGLVVGVLRTVNSAAFGLMRKVDDVQHAVALLGRSKLENFVLGEAVRNALPTAPVRGFDARRFWHAAFFRASLARALADRLHPAEMSRSFTGGLLQDMAVPLLAHARPDDYGEVLEEWHGSPKTELHTLERSALGWSHDEIGAHLGATWELPEALTAIIDSHHDHEGLSDAELLPAMRLVSVHRETEREYGIEAMLEEGKSRYGLAPDWVTQVVAESDEKALELSQTLVG